MRYSVSGFSIHTLSPPPDVILNSVIDPKACPKAERGRGGGILSGFSHTLSPPPDFELSEMRSVCDSAKILCQPVAVLAEKQIL